MMEDSPLCMFAPRGSYPLMSGFAPIPIFFAGVGGWYLHLEGSPHFVLFKNVAIISNNIAIMKKSG